MTLAPGSRLGPYEIVAPLGAGGMGEVYRGRDTRLDRAVAIKVIARHLSASTSLRQRFERESKVISQLSHPNICTLFDVGHHDGTDYLVMELLEGHTLADRLRKGPLPLAEALRCGAEIARALHAAHGRGIVHRDLKPGNLLLTAVGVKVLDFGLARVLGPPPAASTPSAEDTGTALTGKGTLVGTLPYMSPEQVEGREADTRSDIFALGLVLHEMITGNRAFGGPSHAALIGAVLRDEPPPISRAVPAAPRALDRVVATCLAKNPDARWQSAHDVAVQLEGIRLESSLESPVAGPARRARLAFLPWLVATAGVAAAILGLRAAWTPPGRPPLLRSFLVPPPGTTFEVYAAYNGGALVSPDGRSVTFSAHDADGSSRLWIRDLAALDSRPLAGTEGAIDPFWSPDSRSIGFFSRGRLRIVDVSPSPPPAREIAVAPDPHGGCWGPDGTILYSPDYVGPLMRVPAAGGQPATATSLDRGQGEATHRYPHFLPDGRHFLYWIGKFGSDNAPLGGPRAVFAGSLDGEAKRLVLAEDTGVAYASGYLLFQRARDIMAARFDLKSLSIASEPIVLVHDVDESLQRGTRIFSASERILLYAPRGSGTWGRTVRLDRTGREVSAIGPAGKVPFSTVSPDGRSVALSLIDGGLPSDLWLYDTADERGIRLTRDALPQLAPVFTPDNRHLFYSTRPNGPWDIWELTLPAGKDPRPFVESDAAKSANDVSPDGKYLLFREFSTATLGDLKIAELGGDRRIRSLVASTADETNGDFSPDGRWVAYASDETGRKEIYVASFSDPARRFRVSTEGGTQPRWARDGRTIYYMRSGTLVAVSVGTQRDALAFGEGRALFPLPLMPSHDIGFDWITRYDVTPDGGFVALVRPDDPAPGPLVMISDWTSLMESR